MPGPRKGAPRSSVRRPSLTVRLAPDGLAFLDAECERLDVQRSEIVRAALKAWARLPERQRRL